MTTHLDPAIHYPSSITLNCCTNGQAPDWTRFDWLEIIPCQTVEITDLDGIVLDYATESGCSESEAHFFCIFGHCKDPCEGIEDITDCATLELADAVAEYLANLSGLPIH
jgi:hypothetical protein